MWFYAQRHLPVSVNRPAWRPPPEVTSGGLETRGGLYLAVTLRCKPALLTSPLLFRKLVHSGKKVNLVGEYLLSSRKLASGRRSACCTYKGYNENSFEARYGVMRSAKRTQTYWLAWWRGIASGGGGGRGTPLARRGTPSTTPVPPRRRLNSRHYFNTTTMRT